MTFFIENRRQIMVTGDLNEQNVASYMRVLQSEIVRGPIEMLITSGGGDIVFTLALAKLMMSFQKKHTIRTIGLGEVSSAAVLLLAAGSPGERYLMGGCPLGLHEGNYSFKDVKKSVSEWEHWMTKVRAEQNSYWDFLASTSEITADEWQRTYETPKLQKIPAELARTYRVVDHVVNELPEPLVLPSQADTRESPVYRPPNRFQRVILAMFA